MKYLITFILINSIALIICSNLFASGNMEELVYPPQLSAYNDSGLSGVGEILRHRMEAEPLNLIVSLIFLCAILHSFLASKFSRIAHRLEKEHAKKMKTQKDNGNKYKGEIVKEVSFSSVFFHFLGEVEVVFGLWGVALLGAISLFHSWGAAVSYIHSVNYTEPMFVVVIMSLAATRPVMQLAENSMRLVANLSQGSPTSWWFAILTLGPLLGSFITEPAAMTISALLLAKQFYNRKPSLTFAYATMGLLFVNISVGGTLSHFAAPPVLMVAGKWHWDFSFMLFNFGWKAVIGILFSNLLYYFIFRNELSKMNEAEVKDNEAGLQHWHDRNDLIPVWVTVSHLLFMFWTVLNAHSPALFIGGFLFFLGFNQATVHHQNRLDLKPPLLVGFFLAGLVTHGGVQSWWIAPILSSLTEIPLMLGATFLTAFNDNAAITFLSTLVPSFSDGLKYAVVAGAVTGGGLTVIANAPNPAGQSILQKFFPDGVSPLNLAIAAMVPTIIMGLSFMLLR